MDRSGGKTFIAYRSMFIRPNYKLGNGSDHNNAKKYGPYFVNPYWVGLENHCCLI